MDKNVLGVYHLPSQPCSLVGSNRIGFNSVWSANLSLRFNGHFHGEPGLTSTRLSPFCIPLVKEMVVTTAAIRHAKLQSNSHHQQTNTEFFTGQIPFLLHACCITNSVTALKGKH